jgi:hypothetical protein
MSIYLAKLKALREKNASPGNCQNCQNPIKAGFGSFDSTSGSSLLLRAEAAHREIAAGIYETALTKRNPCPYASALAALGTQCPAYVPEERCRQAIADATAVMPAGATPYASALAALRAKSPDHVPEDRWRQAIADATAFISEWGGEAQTFGWTVTELFGLHPVPERPAANYSRLSRLDDIGLIWLLRGRPVIELTATEAAFRCPDGAILTYHRHNASALVPLLNSGDDILGGRP